MSDRDAIIAGNLLWEGTTLFKYLEPGDRFRFPNQTTTAHTKHARTGWYTDVNGLRFRTGARTAVYLVTPATQR